MAKVVGEVAVTIGADITPLQTGLYKGSSSLDEFGNKLGTMGKQVANANKAANGLGGSFSKLATVSNRTRAQIQNASFQVSDLIVQLQGGTRATTAFSQQLPQLLGGFGAVGAVAGVLAGIGIPALALAFNAMKGDTETAAEGMKALEEAIKSVVDRTQDAKDRLALLQTGIATVEELRLQEQINALMATRTALLERIESGAGRNLDVARRTVDEVQSSIDAYQAQLDALRAANAALTEQERQQARIESGYRSYANSRLASEEQARAKIAQSYQLYADTRVEANKLASEIGHAAANALALAGVDISSGVSKAATEAARLAANLNISLNQALSLKNLQDSINHGGGRGQDPRKFMDGGPLAGSGKPLGFELPTAGSGGGRSRGGGGAASGPDRDEFEALRDRFATEAELVSEKYAQDMERLREFRAAKLVTEAEFNELERRMQSEHVEGLRKLDNDAFNQKLQLYSGALGDVASLMQSENEKLFKIGKVAALAKASVEGVSAASAAWDKGMAAGGPPVALAFSAASLAKTAGYISSLQSATPSGGGAGAVVGAIGGAPSVPAPRRIAEFRVEGNNVRGLGPLIDDINEALDQGYHININYTG